MMVTTGDDRGTCGRAERRRVELRVAQACLGDAFQRWRRDDATEGAWHAIAGVIGHDQQNVWRTLRGHDAWGPVGLRVLGILFDHSAKLRRRRRQLIAL